MPATVGNGKLVFTWILKYGAIQSPLTSENLLMCTGFARMFLLGVSTNCGFIGGVIFPFLTIGMIAGAVASQEYPDLPVGLCVSTFMVAIPCGFVPVPITFSVLSAYIFFLGAYQASPIFVAVFTSYTIICGSGLMLKMATESNKRETTMKEDWEKRHTIAAGHGSESTISSTTTAKVVG